MKPGRDETRRLPGTLCDETPETPPAARAVAGRWEPRPDDAIPTPIHDRLRAEYGALLLERDEAVARAEKAERKLQLRHAELSKTYAELADALARIRGLEQTVRAYAGHACDRGQS